MASKKVEKHGDIETDEAIVARVVGGDIDIFALLIGRYEPKLLRYATYLIHDQMTAHDVVQDTFIKAYQNLQGFNPKYKFSSWIYRIAHNEAMNTVKKSKHISPDSFDELHDYSYDANIAELIDTDMLKEHVLSCVNKLDPKYREVVQLVYYEHMKYEEVSDILHVPTSTVGVWLTRAKKRLKQICEQQGVTR
jgi:RNA polymerase sigma-70 factor, ECF subfamily